MQGAAPVVVASEDILADPEAMLAALCDAIGMPFDAHSSALFRRAERGLVAPFSRNYLYLEKKSYRPAAPLSSVVKQGVS